MLWPAIRNLVIRILIDQEVFGDESLIRTSAKKTASLSKIIRCLTNGLIYNWRLFYFKPHILFFNSGITNINIDGKYFNRVTDNFAFCYPDSTLLIEDDYEWQHLRPRAYQNVTYQIFFRIASDVLSRHRLLKIKEEPILEFIKFINSRIYIIFGYQLSERQKSFLKKNLFRFCRNLKIELLIYSALFRKLEPRVIFFEDGCYGWFGHIIRLAKEMGIKTAEAQHGLVSSGHSAYNFAPKILKSSVYCKYTPDFFLTYGQFWEDHIRITSQKVTIGNPFYEMMKDNYKNGGSSGKQKLLLLSSGENFQFYVDIANNLKKTLNKLKILIRPHPAERKIVFNKYGYNAGAIMIDYNDNLYSQLSQASIVVGEASTALFEALGFAKKIFSVHTPFSSFWLPECPFESIESVEQLAEKIQDNKCGETEPSLADLIWANNWEVNYRHFIKHFIGLNIS